MTAKEAVGKISTSMVLNGVTVALLTLSMFVLAGMSAGIENNKEKLSTIVGNRFTSQDGLEVWKAIGELKAVIPNEVPPKWFIDRVDKLEGQLTELQEQVRALRKD